MPEGESRSGTVVESALRVAREVGHLDDPRVRDLVGEAHMLNRVSIALLDRLGEGIRVGALPDQSASIGRLLTGSFGARSTDIAYELKQLNLTRTFVQYSSGTLYAGVSALARILTTDWAAQNSTITLMYKNEPIVTADTLTSSQATALFAKNANAFLNYNNGTAIIQPGITPSGQYADTVIGCDWFKGDIQTTVFNALYGAKKIPQTDGGNHIIATQIEAACTDAVNNGLLGPGVWNAQGFGQLSQGDYMPKGFYVYAPPISQQSQADRSARRSVPFQVAAKLAGAVQTVDVAVSVNS
jgi:hypothetical protein